LNPWDEIKQNNNIIIIIVKNNHSHMVKKLHEICRIVRGRSRVWKGVVHFLKTLKTKKQINKKGEAEYMKVAAILL